MPGGSKRVLVIGGYGLIGAAIVRAALANGHFVGALGRNEAIAMRVLAGIPWHFADLRELTTPQAWVPFLEGWDVVVNAAGALQGGPSDDLELVHHMAPAALFSACAARGIRVVQISAVGAELEAATVFQSSKARGDSALRASGAEHIILRPGLVLAPTAYGGTALLRMLAAIPAVQPLALPDAQIQTIGMDNLTFAVNKAINAELPDNVTLDLVASEPISLSTLVADLREWLGFAPARLTVDLPGLATGIVARVADMLGSVGWRSPLRSTALQVLADGVLGDPAPAAEAGLQPAGHIQCLRNMPPAGSAARLQARMLLLMPVVVFVLLAFWLASGLIGLWFADAASQVLVRGGWSAEWAMVAVVFWSLVDIVLAAGLVWRRTARLALYGMIAVPVIYISAATAFTPWLWAEPLGPLVKSIPATALALVALPMIEAR